MRERDGSFTTTRETRRSEEEEEENRVREQTLTCCAGPFIEALLVCAILITMLFTGACAIFSLQTPDKWEAPRIKREL